MLKQDEIFIIKNSNLSSFCDSKLKDYTNSIKTALGAQDLVRLKEVLTSLSEESETIGASHISSLSREISKRIDLFEPETEKTNRRVMRILRILENLEKDSKDYTNTLLYTKKIDIIGTQRTTKLVQLEEETFDDMDIEKEFQDQWKCCIY